MKLKNLKKGMKVVPFKMMYGEGYDEENYKKEISKKKHYLYSIQSMIEFGYTVIKYVDKEKKRVLLTHEKYLNIYNEIEGGNWYLLDEFELYLPIENKQYLLDFREK